MSGHQWIVIVTYGLTDAEARATHDGTEQRLDAEHRLSADGPACLNCELMFSPRLAGQPCKAPRYALDPSTSKVRQR